MNSDSIESLSNNKIIDDNNKAKNLEMELKPIKPLEDKIFSAKILTKKLIEITSDFQQLKKNIKSYKNIFIEYVFEKIGFDYKGNIDEPNFLHLSAQAWIIGLFQELEKEINGNFETLSYTTLINLISQIIVKENVFIENMEILIGKFSHLKPFSREDKIFRSMLIDLNSTKNEILKDEKILKNQELNHEEFENIIEKILKISFNIFLNNINSAEENKKSLILYVSIENLKSSDHLTFDGFIKIYTSAKGLKEITDKNLLNQLEGYFKFCLCSFDDLVVELGLFNKNSNNLFFKIFSILPKFKITDIIYKRIDIIKSLGDFSLKNFRLEKVQNFIESIYATIRSNSDSIVSSLENKTNNLKKWINSTACVKNAKEISFEFYARNVEFFAQYYNILFDKFKTIYNPLELKTLEIRDLGKKYVISFKDESMEKVMYFKSLILGYFMSKINQLRGFMFCSDPLLKVNSNEFYFSVEIRKRLIALNPQVFYEIIGYIKAVISRVFFFNYIFTEKINKEKMLDNKKKNPQEIELSSELAHPHEE